MVFLVVSLLLTFKAGQGLICSFSCDTVTAVTTNVESTKYKRRENRGIGYKQHSRAGTSDNVEGIIASSHCYVGMMLTVKV